MFFYGLLCVLLGKFSIRRSKILLGREARTLGTLLMLALPLAICQSVVIRDINAFSDDTQVFLSTIVEIALLAGIISLVVYLYNIFPDAYEADRKETRQE